MDDYGRLGAPIVHQVRPWTLDVEDCGRPKLAGDTYSYTMQGHCGILGTPTYTVKPLLKDTLK